MRILYPLAVLFLALWIIGLAFKVTFWFIHLALVAAVVLFIVGLIGGASGRTTTPTRV